MIMGLNTELVLKKSRTDGGQWFRNYFISADDVKQAR